MNLDCSIFTFSAKTNETSLIYRQSQVPLSDVLERLGISVEGFREKAADAPESYIRDLLRHFPELRRALENSNFERADLHCAPITKAFFHGGYERSADVDWRPKAPDIIHVLRTGLRSKPHHRAPTSLHALVDDNRQEPRLRSAPGSTRPDVQLAPIQVPQVLSDLKHCPYLNLRNIFNPENISRLPYKITTFVQAYLCNWRKCRLRQRFVINAERMDYNISFMNGTSDVVPDSLIQLIAASPLPTRPFCPKSHRESKFLIDDDCSLLCTEVCDDWTSRGELQSARVARNIRKKKKKGSNIFQQCYNLINDQFGGEMSQKQPKNTNIKFRCFWKTTTIYEVIKDRGWVETDSELDWDFFWSDVGWMYEFFDHIHLADHQRFNHFRNYYELTRKDFLIKNLKRMKKILEKDDKTEEAAKYNFFPQTYALPAEYGLFVEEFKRTPGVWIMKPVGKARGRGIFLFTRLNQISEWKKDHRWKSDNPQVENYIVQKYIENPYLIGGKKFDLRIYVLVLSYAPLKAYLYRSGFARFTNAHFSMKKEDIVNKLVHLTNFSIQKHAPTYNSKTGTKWPLHNLKMHMITTYGEERVNALFHEISSLILRSLLSVQNVIIQDKHCFELYGYDILVDSTLKPWLLEVNASPSLAADTPSDHELKYCMLDDVLSLVDMEHRLPPQTPKQVGGFDLLIDQGSENQAKCTSLASPVSLLGCYHDREKQLRQMAKAQAQTAA